MSLQKLRPEVQRLLAITIPVLVLLLAALLDVPKFIHVGAVRRLASVRRREAERQKQQNALEAESQRTERMAVVPQSRDEQLRFLKGLSRIVAASRVQLVSYRPSLIVAGSTTTDPAAGASPSL